jgi:hypothetical protein
MVSRVVEVAGSDDGGHSNMWQFIKMERYQFRIIIRIHTALSTFRWTVKVCPCCAPCLRGFGALGVSEYQANMACLSVVQGPVYGGPGRAGYCTERICGCEPEPFTLKLERILLVGVHGHLWMLVFVLYLDSSNRLSFQPRLLVATLSNPGLTTG